MIFVKGNKRNCVVGFNTTAIFSIDKYDNGRTFLLVHDTTSPIQNRSSVSFGIVTEKGFFEL